MNMLEKKDFKAMKTEMDLFDQQRELIIKKSRDILKNSKRAIYALHRDSKTEASKLLGAAKKGVLEIKKLIAKCPLLSQVGAFNDCLQEYVEASTYSAFLNGKKIPTAKTLGVGTEDYLMGLSDLTGELVRKAVNDSTKGIFDTVEKNKAFVEELYAELLKFNFRSGLLRKKFDSIKYHLASLQDLLLKIKLKCIKKKSRNRRRKSWMILWKY